MCNKKIKLLFAKNWVKVNLFWIPDSFYSFPVIELLGFRINFSMWLIGFQFKKLSWYFRKVHRTFRQWKIESEKPKIGEKFSQINLMKKLVWKCVANFIEWRRQFSIKITQETQAKNLSKTFQKPTHNKLAIFRIKQFSNQISLIFQCQHLFKFWWVMKNRFFVETFSLFLDNDYFLNFWIWKNFFFVEN
jgi:hypothetical protein